MKNVKKILIVAACLMMGLGFTLLIPKVAPITSHASGADLEGFPNITAVSMYDDGEKVEEVVKGTLSIYGVGVDLTGINKFVPETALDNLRFKIDPFPHYKLTDVTVQRTLRDDAPAPTAIPTTLDNLGNNVWLFPLDAPVPVEVEHEVFEDVYLYDYRFELHFARIEYQVQIEADYLDKFNVTSGIAGKIRVGETVTFANQHINNTKIGNDYVRFAYAELATTNGGTRNLEEATGQEYTGTYAITFVASMPTTLEGGKNYIVLGDHVIDGATPNPKIKVHAIYIKTYKVSVTANIDDARVEIFMQSDVYFQPNNGFAKYTEMFEDRFFDEGSKLEIIAYDGDNYDFAGFEGISGESKELIINSLDEDQDIIINYEAKPFKIEYRGYDNIGNYVTLGVSDDSIKFRQTLNFAAINAIFQSMNIAGYEYQGLEIRNTPFVADEIITDTFVQQKLTGDDIVIRVCFMKLDTLTVVMPDSDKGSYKIWRATAQWHKDGQLPLNANGIYEFRTGTRVLLEIESKIADVFAIGSVDGIASIHVKDTLVEVELKGDRRINVTFISNPLNVVSTKPNNNISYGDQTTYRVNQTISVAYEVPKNHEIKGWKLNGKALDTFGSAVVLNGNTLTITLTPEFLANPNNKDMIKLVGDTVNLTLDHDVKTSLKSEILLSVMIPGILIPLALVILTTVFVLNMRRKKMIKELLTEKRDAQIKGDVSGYMQSLREGTFTGTITKEDIKKEIKQQKDDKKK